MTKIIIGAVAVIAIAGMAWKSYSFRSKTSEEKAEIITEKMSRKLDLNQDQKTKVYDINLARIMGYQKAYEAGRKKEIVVAAVNKWK